MRPIRPYYELKIKISKASNDNIQRKFLRDLLGTNTNPKNSMITRVLNIKRIIGYRISHKALKVNF